METKKQIRAKYLQIRNAISEEERKQKSLTIINTLLKSQTFTQATHILNFCSYQSEVITDSLLDACIKSQKNMFYPKVFGKEMEFYQVNHMDELLDGYKGIREPDEKIAKKFIPESGQKIVLIMPGLCFDSLGGRLGYGGGFYDRYVKRLEETNISDFSYTLMALAFDEQITLPGIIPMNIHDCSPDYLITDKQFIIIQKETE